MEGVTTALVGFILLCVAFPRMVKNKPQYYVAFISVLAIILLSSLQVLVDYAGFTHFIQAVGGLLQIVSLVALVLACGGLSPRQLAGEMGRSIEVMRRGGEEQETIIPLGADAYEAMAAHARAAASSNNPRPGAPSGAGAPSDQAPPMSGIDQTGQENTIPLE